MLVCCTEVETLYEKISLTENLQRAEMQKVISNHFLQKTLQVKEQTVALILNKAHITIFRMCTIIGKVLSSLQGK